MLAKAILTEIYMALQELSKNGNTHVIYISKFDLNEEDKTMLTDILKEGTIHIEDRSAFQKAQWVETIFSGVWKGVIFDLQGTPVVETIEICHSPSFAQAQEEDIKEATQKLKSLLHIRSTS